MAGQAHPADRVVVGQEPQETVEDSIIFHISDHLVVSAGCEILLVPGNWTGDVAGKRILVGWKNTSQAIKAVRGALSFLREADTVMILASASEEHAEVPASDRAGYLGHHGIEAVVLPPNEMAGKGILEAAGEHGCDLIVMGAFSHSRLCELFAGGATDDIMRHTTIPVLMRQ